ncbi:MAG: hypothetical protein DI537_32860 [Stutzerimonas stutzeri]|nr:MAG: hypothetical protein DI537_32860 [Stutzerimonas stutzeri]
MTHRETYHLDDTRPDARFDVTMFAVGFLAVIICVGVPAVATYLGFTKLALGAHLLTGLLGLGCAIKIARGG